MRRSACELIEVHPAHEVGAAYSPAANDERWRYTYDYMGRRVEKHHDKYVSGAWVTQSKRRFVYDGWNMIAELDALNLTSGEPTLVRAYTWGLDLSGQAGNASVAGLHGAGGVGGLLAVDVKSVDPDTTESGGFAFTYDGNGNVGQMVAPAEDYPAGTPVARTRGGQRASRCGVRALPLWRFCVRRGP